MMKWVLLIYLFFNALCYQKGVEARPFQEFIFQMTSLCLILSSAMFPVKGKLGKPEERFNIALFTFFAWSLFTFLRLEMGWSILLNTFLGIGVYLTTIRHLDYEDVRFVIKGSLWIVAFSIGYLAFQFLGFDPRGFILRGTIDGKPACSIWNLEAHYGLYLAMMFPLLLGISKLNDLDIPISVKGIWEVLIIVLGVSLLFFAVYPSHSSGAYLGLVIATLFYLWHKKRVAFWACLFPILLGLFIYLNYHDNPMGTQKSRLDMWQKVIQDAHTRPLGYGLDSFRLDERDGATKYFKYAFNDTSVRVRKIDGVWKMGNEVPREFIERVNAGRNPLDYWDSPHNEFIQVFYELGHPGIIIVGVVMFFLYQVFKFSKRRPLTVATFASLISIAVFSCVQFPFHVARIGHMIPIITGLFIVSARDDN